MGKSVIIILFLILLLSPGMYDGCGPLALDIGPSISSEDLGQAAQDIEQRRKLYIEDQEDTIKAIGARLLSRVEKPLRIDFQVQESEDINAGATFGKIVVTTGMMRFVQSVDELAVVLGHEITHIEKGHLAKGIFASIPVIIGSIAAESAAPGSGRIVQLGGGLFTQKFSRDMEREADHYGLTYAHKAGFDVRKGIEIWERFAIELPQTQRAGLLSSHPTSTERLARARKIAETLQGNIPAEEIRPLVERVPTAVRPQKEAIKKHQVEHPSAQAESPGGGEVMADRHSPVFHYPGCNILSKVEPKDLIRFNSRREAVASGGRPCEVCRP